VIASGKAFCYSRRVNEKPLSDNWLVVNWRLDDTHSIRLLYARRLARHAAAIHICRRPESRPGPGLRAFRLGDGRFSSADDEDFGFVGAPGQIVEQMRPFIDLGVDYFILDCSGFPELTTLELLISDVLPVLNG
jgi:hypothetical protein